MLGPDACQMDRSAPCFYWHTKVAALNGGKDGLSDEDLEFVGVAPCRKRSNRWHEPKTPPLDEASDPGGRRLGFLA